MRAPISNIFHSARHDGAGLRTAVFFGGCNMRCAWCHNPESLSASPKIMFYAEKCVGCGECTGRCEHISLDGGRLNISEGCNLCGDCVYLCLGEALCISNREMTVPEVMREVVKDKTYYRFSGGGITATGGECLLYPEFLCELFSACRREGINTCVESALYVPCENVLAVEELTDNFIVDLKLFDPEIHRKYTGVDNRRILENVRYLAKARPDLLVRTPLIPGVTDTEENLFAILDFLSASGVTSWELLPYNPLARSKYLALGKEYSDFGEKQSREFIEKTVDALNKKSTSVKVLLR